MYTKNTLRITQTAATVAALMGFSMLVDSDCPNEIVLDTAKRLLGGKTVQRTLLYNPDAIALWLYQKYTEQFLPVLQQASLALPVSAVMPSVTPVCFASMYSGLMPEKHGIQTYTKPVLTVSTLFDCAIAQGHKPIIISTEGDSITQIFLERKMDYIVCKTPEECNEKAMIAIKENQHDIVVVYNGNYDATMHRWGPESPEALSQLAHNAQSYAALCATAKASWQGFAAMTAFLPDHGCHEIDGQLGSHGLDMAEDMNIIHFYNFF